MSCKMSRVYDNWGKLVGAVVNREELRRLAYCESLSGSSVSADFSTRFSFDSALEDVPAGYCEDSNERVLVVHMDMANIGTLFDHLHNLESSTLMSWHTRIKVALDVARGIEYLHEYAVPRTIHQNINSSNILLDATWTAKVSGPQQFHLSLQAGYYDPEYYKFHLLTTKSDVYSFGVLLLELLSGYKAIFQNEDGVPRNLVDYVIPFIIDNELHRILDRRVPPPAPFQMDAVEYVSYLAADCVLLEGQDRPTMSELVNSLYRALEACLAPMVLVTSSTSSLM